MFHRASICETFILLFTLSTLRAADKNGVAPSAISLPAGPGSIQGLGDSFQPQLNSGSGTYRVPLILPRGTGGLAPELAITYNTGNGNGALGLGWTLDGVPSIRRSLDGGVPLYVDGPNGLDDDLDARVDNPEEIDVFTGIDGEELVPLADGSFRAENEGGFIRYARSGEGWEARSPDGTRRLFGLNASTRVEQEGKVFAWCLERLEDQHGNAITYEYREDPGAPAQKYVQRICWGQPDAFLGVLLGYTESRPDVTVSYLPGFELRTSLRLREVEVYSQGIPAQSASARGDLDGDGRVDNLLRRYQLEYEVGAPLSRLSSLTLLGTDGITALPGISLGYTSATPQDDVTVSLLRSRGAPAEAFDSPSAELADLNGDSLPDLLLTSVIPHRVALNGGVGLDGALRWLPPRPVGNAPGVDLASDRVHLADMSADGLADLMVKGGNTSFTYFASTGSSSWAAAPVTLRNTDTWPLWPFEGETGKVARSVDLDLSRTNDVLVASHAGLQVWLLLPGGRYSRELRRPPPVHEGQVFRFDQPGTQVADVNGDRLQDLVWVQQNRVIHFPGRGRGELAPPVSWSLDRTLTPDEVERAAFADIDGDGLVDLTLVRPGFEPTGVVYWLNRFQAGLAGARVVRGLPPPHQGDAVRWADMNGNGTTDLVLAPGQSDPGDRILVVDFVPAGKANLLTSIENGLGLHIELSYESSTAQMLRAEASGAPWQSRAPLVLTVVSRIVEDDGLGHRHEEQLTYRDPHYDGAKQELRGFREAESHERGDASVEGRIVRRELDTGREIPALKGRLLGETVLGDSGKLYHQTLQSWGHRALARGLDGREVTFAFPSAADQVTHEGTSSPVRVHAETDYDDFGNVTGERNHGVVDREGDELFVERTFDVRPARWLLRLVSTATTTDGAGRRVDDHRYFHDEAGELVRSESWLDLEDRWIPILRQRLDAFGNVVETRDALDHTRLLEMDPLLHAHPVRETLVVGDGELTLSANHDLGLGVITEAVDFHGQRTTYTYDVLGRLVETSRPGGAGEYYEYAPGNPVSRVSKSLRLDSNSTFDSHTYSDALGRLLGTKVAAENGRWRCLNFRDYNASKLAHRSWLPHDSATSDYSLPELSLPHEDQVFDARGRPVETRRADGSRVRQEYSPLAVSVFSGNDLEAGGRPDLRQLDGLGRLISVEERNGTESYVTRYTWTPVGQLESIEDALGNVRRFHFDSLGRLARVEDPDRGMRAYSHDDAGNRTRREDARGLVTRYEHDAAGRLVLRETPPLPGNKGGAGLITYHHDTPAGELDLGDGQRGTARNTVGRLAWIEDPSGDEHFSYDERGNVEWTLKRIRDPETGILVPYRTQYVRDLLNREVEVVFPDNDRCRYLRSAGGFVERIDGGPDGKVILASVERAPGGQLSRIELGNGVEELFTHDTAQRLKTLRVTGPGQIDLLHDELDYDAQSNVTAITDRRSGVDLSLAPARERTAHFTHDELDRLTRVEYGEDGSAGRIDYELDALGNLLRQSTPAQGLPGHIADASINLGSLAYAGGRSGRDGAFPTGAPGPHAVTGTENGEEMTYDPDGNLLTRGEGTLVWDEEDHLVGFAKPGVAATYIRDHAGRRILKRIARGEALSETHAVDMGFEVVDGAPVKLIHFEGRRLARVAGVLDPGRDRVQRIVLAEGWNQGTAAVEDPSPAGALLGADAAVYELQGSAHVPLDLAAPLPPGRPLWVYTPSARLAVLRGPALPATETISSGPYHAWPLLKLLRPSVHVPGTNNLAVYSSKRGRWFRRDPSLPSFLNDLPEELGAAVVLWSPEVLNLQPEALRKDAVRFDHTDHLGTPAVVTGEDGRLIEERSTYPYGAPRSTFRPQAQETDDRTVTLSKESRWGISGKERDLESGLVDLGARSYLEIAGVFSSPDPRYAEVAALALGGPADQASFQAFLTNPQMGNLYAYATRNPLKLVDPSGLDIVFSKALRESPVFQEALALFKSTEEGQRLLARIEKSGARVTLSANRTRGINPKSGQEEEVYGLTYHNLGNKNARVEINVGLHKKLVEDKNARILELADTIHHELRHVEGNMNRWDLAIARRNLAALGEAAKIMKLPPVGLDSRLRMGDEVHAGLDLHGDDPYNAVFKEQAKAAQFEKIKANVKASVKLIETDLD